MRAAVTRGRCSPRFLLVAMLITTAVYVVTKAVWPLSSGSDMGVTAYLSSQHDVVQQNIASMVRPRVQVETLREISVNNDVNTDCRLPNKQQFYSQSTEDKALLELYFSNPVICNGTFVELGALDGVLYSNTKFYEDALGWRGVLIEANPNNYALLRDQRPRSRKYSGAVCPEGQSNVTMAFRKDKRPLATGGDKSQMSSDYRKRWIPKDHVEVVVPCRSLAAYLHDAGIRHIDLFSLDVEGAELLVLQTMDWDIPVRMFLVEMGREHDEETRELLYRHGYFPARQDIRALCEVKECAENELFINPAYQYSSVFSRDMIKSG